MAAFMLARVSAQKTEQTLFCMQAVDEPLTPIQRAKEHEFFEEILRILSTQKQNDFQQSYSGTKECA